MGTMNMPPQKNGYGSDREKEKIWNKGSRKQPDTVKKRKIYPLTHLIVA
jgi:hypothetical protein